MPEGGGAAVTRSVSAPSARGFLFTAALLVSILIPTLLSQVSAELVPRWLRGQRSTYSALWPQAWTFFAGAPTADTIVAYRVPAGDSTLSSQDMQNVLFASSRNLWGLSQSGSTQLIEMQFLADRIPERFWRSCRQSGPAGCQSAFADANVYSMSNTFQAPTLCGPIAFVVERPQPGALGTDRPIEVRRPIRAVLVRLSCPG